MEKIEVGDVVKCIDVSGDSSKNHAGKHLKLNSEYIVNNIYTCSCGSVSLDVGIPVHSETQKCGDHTFLSKGIHWCASKRFIKKKSLSNKDKKENLNIILKPKEIVKELIAN